MLKEDYVLNVSLSGNKLVAHARRKGGLPSRNQLNISFKVYLPGEIASHLRTSGGSIRLKGLSGKQDFATSGGSLHVEGLSGEATGRTSGGSIRVLDCSDKLDLSTSGGSISASSCKGNINLTTSGGSIELEDMQGDVHAGTSGGSIEARRVSGTLRAGTSGGSILLDDISGSLDANTSGGRITARLTSLGEYVRLTTSAGGVDLTLPSGKGLNLDLRAGRVNAGRLEAFSGTAKEDQIVGKLAGKGVPVEVRASGGNISLNWN